MLKKKIEVWFCFSKNILVLKSSSKITFEFLKINESKSWQTGYFKNPYSFEFLNGPSFLKKNGFKKIESFFEYHPEVS